MKKLLLLTLFFVLTLTAQAQGLGIDNGPEFVKIIKVLQTHDSQKISDVLKKNGFVEESRSGTTLVYHEATKPSNSFFVALSRPNPIDSLILVRPVSDPLNGMAMEFNSSGQPISSVTYVNGEKKKEEQFSLHHGLVKVLFYENDSIIKEQNFKPLLNVLPKDIVALVNDFENVRADFDVKYNTSDSSFMNSDKVFSYRYSQADNDTSLFVLEYQTGDSIAILSSYNREKNFLKRGWQYIYHLDSMYLFQQSFYFEGQKISETEFYQNGKEKRISNFKTLTVNFESETYKHGEEIHFRADGTQLSKGSYHLGKKHGEWLDFGPNGQNPEKMSFYEKGALLYSH